MTALNKQESKSDDSASVSENGMDSDDGFSEGENEKVELKSTKLVKASTSKLKPPTLEEINELKETRNLFHSNLFRLQVNEMLSELKTKEKYTKYIDSWLENFQNFLRKLKSQDEREDVNTIQWLQNCPMQLPLALTYLDLDHAQQKKQLYFQFIKPKIEAYLIGAASTGTLLGNKLIADVCVQMPAECFQKDNYLNLSYDKKRALYLTYLGVHMIQNQKFFNGLTKEHLNFSCYANNPLKPILEVTPPSEIAGLNISRKLSIRIFVAADENTFKLSRFVPWNSNIRVSLLHNSCEEKDTIPLATPTYNGNVLFDLTMRSNHDVVHKIIGKHKNLQEGLLLLKVWLQQRQLHIGYSGFNVHLLAMFIVYLYKQRKLQPNMSSYQVVRTVWNHLAHSAWNENGKGISLCANHSDIQPNLEQFHTYYDVVFVDTSGYYNICARLSCEIYKRVRQESQWAVEMLNDTKINSFQSLFMVKYPLYMQFDHILKINNADAIEQLLELYVQPADRCDHVGHIYPQLLKIITELLHKGLGKRAKNIIPIEVMHPKWPVDIRAPNCGQQLHLGLILNPEHACEVLDKGPESVAANSEEFRRFWGEKAELRRFQDGTITESVVWASSNDTQMQKRLIVRSIVLHLLQHHLQLTCNDVEYVAGELETVCRITSAFKIQHLHEHHKDISQDSDVESLALRVIRCFDDLARKLRDLKDLPLDIVSIIGISPVFRYCEPEPILPQARFIGDKLHATHVNHAIIQLSASGKWPSELDAFRALKTAFYLQIAQLLKEKYHLRSQVTYDCLLILKQGYCFAIELAHPKEIALLRREAQNTEGVDRKIVKYIDCVESIALERRHYVLPRINGALHALYQEQPSFGPTVVIAKRWLYAQLIDNGLWPDECTELLIAMQFLRPHTQQPSCSPQIAFIRFLHLLAHTDWRTEMFLINFQNSMDENEWTDLECRFNTQRDTFPPLCIATAYDQKHYGQLWTNMQTPNLLILARATMLAREALDILQTSLLSQTQRTLKLTRIFQASSSGYDLVIQLKPDLLANTLAFELGSPFVMLTKPNWRLPIADSKFLQKAVQYLREAYNDFAAFFYNPCGGKEIAVVWKPEIENEKDFKVTEVNGCTLNASGKRLLCRKSILIEDFKFILKDFYLRIDTTNVVYQASQLSLDAHTRSKDKHANTGKRYFNTSSKDLSIPSVPLKKIKSNANVESKNIAKLKSKNMIANKIKQKKTAK